MHEEKPVTIYAAIIANLIIAIAKFAVALVSGSSAMISEGIHSSVDTGNQLLLLIGNRRSKKPPDRMHPFGHGKELYFWGLMVSVILFGVGGGMSIYEGISHIQHPAERGSPFYNYLVLGIAFIVEGVSLTIALKKLNEKIIEGTFLEKLRNSKNPEVYVVVAEDTAAELGITVAIIGVYLSHRFNSPIIDATASLIIGFILLGVAAFLAWETRGLLVGERASNDIIESIKAIVEGNDNVRDIVNPLTMQLGPDEVLLNLRIKLDSGLSSNEIYLTLNHIEEEIRDKSPQVKKVFIDIENPNSIF